MSAARAYQTLDLASGHAANDNAPASSPANGNYLYYGNLKCVRSVINDGKGPKTIYNIYDSGGALVHIFKASENKKTDYVTGPTGTIARVTNGQEAGSGATGIEKVTYMHPDHLGSAQAGTNASGEVVWREQYTPFGETYENPAANDNLDGFTGHIKDKATGLNYMQARYYDPVIGRFLSIDPVTFMDTGDSNQFNRYMYGNNDPVNMIDPNGEDAFGFNFDFKVVVGGGVRVAGEVSYDVDTKQLRVQGVFGEHGGGKIKASGSLFSEPSSDRPDSISMTSSAIVEGTAEIKLGGTGLGINPTASVDVTASSETGLTSSVDTGSWNPTAEAGPVSVDENGRKSFNVGGGLGLTAGVDHKVDVNIGLDFSDMFEAMCGDHC